MASMTIEETLEKWQVIAPGQWENEDGPEDWWAVENDNGIVAFFGDEVDANRYRLWMVNRDLNP
jgi:hypothetical protein